jgi:hypothetical protein
MYLRHLAHPSSVQQIFDPNAYLAKISSEASHTPQYYTLSPTLEKMIFISSFLLLTLNSFFPILTSTKTNKFYLVPARLLRLTP